jgi:hypothetical protein
VYFSLPLRVFSLLKYRRETNARVGAPFRNVHALMHPSASSGTVVPVPPKAPSNQPMERGGAPTPLQRTVAPQDLLDGGNLHVGRDTADVLTDLLDSAAISPQPDGSGPHKNSNPFDEFAHARTPINAQIQQTTSPPQGHGQVASPPQQLQQNAQAAPHLMTSPGAPFGASQGAYPPPQPLIQPNQPGTLSGQPNSPAITHPSQSAGYLVHQQQGVQQGLMSTPLQQTQHPQSGQGPMQHQASFPGQNVSAFSHPFGMQQQQQLVPPPQYSGQPTPKPPQMNINQFDPFAKK